MTIVKRHAIFLLILSVYFIISLYRLQDIPHPWYDEIAHFNTAQNLAREGRLWCDFYSQKFTEGTLFNSMPIQWIILGAAIKFLNAGWLQARLIYLMISLLTLLALYSLSLKLFDKRTAILTVLLLASSRIFFMNARQLIPQVSTAFFALTAILLFYAASEKKKKSFFVYAGVSAGLAVLSHPTGAGVVMAIAALCLYKKVYIKNTLIFFAALAAAVFPYLLYVADNFQEYSKQTGIVIKQIYHAQPVLLNMLDEFPVRYFSFPPLRDAFKSSEGAVFRNDYLDKIRWMFTGMDLRVYFCKVAGTTLFLFSLFYLLFKKGKSHTEKELFIISFVYTAFLSLHPNKFNAYIYIISPYLAMCLAIFFRDLVFRQAIIKTAAIIMAALFFAANYAFIYKELNPKKYIPYFTFINNTAKNIPQGAVVAGPLYFWLGFDKSYKFISANEVIYIAEKMFSKDAGAKRFNGLPPEERLAVIRKIFEDCGIEYVLLTRHSWEGLTEAAMSAEGFTLSLRKYLYNEGSKETDLLRDNYYKNIPAAKTFEEELYDAPADMPYHNSNCEYQNTLKIYRLRRDN